jgi:hypothetical protein
MTRAKRQQLSAHPRPDGSLEQAASSPIGFVFSEARHGLSPAQCRQANALLRKLERTRPIRESGARGQAKMALRVAGIVSAARRQVIGRSAFGYALHAHRGGNVMRDHGLHILRVQAPRGYQAMLQSRERKLAQAHYEQTGEPLPIGAQPTPSPEAQRIQDLIEAWEGQQWQSQRDYLRW